MAEPAGNHARVRSALDAERALILSLGGYAFQVAGGTLVLHERVAVPRFNFVSVEDLSPLRQASFFERALDQYFQRALRPSFRVPLPAAPHVHRTLLELGFRPRPEALVLLGRGARVRRPSAPASGRVRVGEEVPTSMLVPFWVSAREAPELSSAIEIVRHHPNPTERAVPVVLEEGGVPVAAALVYARGDAAFLFGIATAPAARGRGLATSLLEWIVTHPPAKGLPVVAAWSESRRLDRRLAKLGFVPWARWRVYELGPDAELSLPPNAPSAGPLWRPPRSVREGSPA